jgi:hypothetical protein
MRGNGSGEPGPSGPAPKLAGVAHLTKRLAPPTAGPFQARCVPWWERATRGMPRPSRSCNCDTWLRVPECARVGKREAATASKQLTTNTTSTGPAQKALPSPNRGLNYFFASPLHISSQGLSVDSHLGTIDGSPPGVPGGGITGVLPPPTAGAAIPGSTPAGGQMMPFDCES